MHKDQCCHFQSPGNRTACLSRITFLLDGRSLDDVRDMTLICTTPELWDGQDWTKNCASWYCAMILQAFNCTSMILRNTISTVFVFKLKCALSSVSALYSMQVLMHTNKGRASSTELDQALPESWNLSLLFSATQDQSFSFIEQNNEPQAILRTEKTRRKMRQMTFWNILNIRLQHLVSIPTWS